MSRSRLLVSVATVSAVAMLGVLTVQRTLRAQSEAPQPYAGPNVPVGGKVTASGPVERTPEAMAADEALAPAGPAPAIAVEVRPTMPADQYAALKAAANAQTPSARPASASAAGPSAETPVLTGVNFFGAKEGAIGPKEFPSDDDMDVSRAQVA